ncbi:hypothetical protein AB0F59_30530 [Micromonospora lupini]|uniref:hypothetical protein n=1 Tax=Micromonospora lupini TaxID=285679 RepID=UPI003405A992
MVVGLFAFLVAESVPEGLSGVTAFIFVAAFFAGTLLVLLTVAIVGDVRQGQRARAAILDASQALLLNGHDRRQVVNISGDGPVYLNSSVSQYSDADPEATSSDNASRASGEREESATRRSGADVKAVQEIPSLLAALPAAELVDLLVRAMRARNNV